MKRIGIMGGAFDPIHLGHLLAAEAAREQHALEEVWFMPSHIPPHKHQAGVSGEQRLAMVEAATHSHPAFKPLDIELRRGGVSYTVDTIKALRKQHPELELFFIIGADMVNYLPKWEGIEELTGMLTFIGLQRPGSFLELDALPPYIQESVLLADMPLVDISSSLIRKRIANGLSVRYMVPEAVYEYIVRSGLYGIHP
ncbi:MULTISPECIES: nicotinate-nucleotide adenylyltransferase [Paenibacillus]|uniref:Probable nicotinate-nucleotide adenylyltransferase n=1 Tax=Paenibacillus vini TaxID=1476024 RepID=A0ABQ4MHE4_9BACL|nr:MULTISPECIES: nicotinate-nucleotide adenylyltransferase [Paenibacillus]MBQ4897655.1 nicotinate-nucleotide adenylyltransferase [Paenibacillus sp. Marseille-P2973]MDN4070112.1 nicotinate-nucleotide adenylyltransferase [Paenibacillus vini]GIP55415.1 putative nicotinate-nucleotide adenylyltransferase [Paenibacillus vini]